MATLENRSIIMASNTLVGGKLIDPVIYSYVSGIFHPVSGKDTLKKITNYKYISKKTNDYSFDKIEMEINDNNLPSYQKK